MFLGIYTPREDGDYDRLVIIDMENEEAEQFKQNILTGNDDLAVLENEDISSFPDVLEAP